MFHPITFRVEFEIDLETAPKNPLERVQIHKGLRVRSQIKPMVAESPDGPIEVADLYFEDGTVARQVPFAYFSFAEQEVNQA